MYLIMAGDLEIKDSIALEQKGKSQDFKRAKQKADKLLESFAQVEVIDSKTNECVYFQTISSRPVAKGLIRKRSEEIL
jgi:hypothetical protein